MISLERRETDTLYGLYITVAKLQEINTSAKEMEESSATDVDTEKILLNVEMHLKKENYQCKMKSKVPMSVIEFRTLE
ncbi:hypothetical protein [Thermoflavimicrobium dichotomicum]|uniref:Uncharacterized protein n=1 Tax=Thermoflavimicrobium dichotomicum TaxID=46223 RepID=A0A1I3L253_9BACL|nr:hypothetical protein [Thermoflavimicrobium dichotomicum]SFI78801.1 hypothetical protein SAMN05421852_1029 [Thermoflavimicrobium dichotomicum]